MLHANKATLIIDTVTFFGRITSRDCVKYSPKSFQALLELPASANASNRSWCLGATCWMRSEIPADAERVAPLRVQLKGVIAVVGSSKKLTVEEMQQ
jgi:hypothetical protein